MEGGRLETICKTDELIKPLLAGVFCADELVRPLVPGKIYIVNETPCNDSVEVVSAKTKEPNLHWVILSTVNPLEVEYLCSFAGNWQDIAGIREALTGHRVYSYPTALQHSTLTGCALYILFEAWMLSRHIFGREIYQRFFLPVVSPAQCYKRDLMVAKTVQTFFQLSPGEISHTLLDLQFLEEQNKREREGGDEKRMQ